ncbi:MFS transporter superfamily protein [Abortiporus biennis]
MSDQVMSEVVDVQEFDDKKLGSQPGVERTIYSDPEKFCKDELSTPPPSVNESDVQPETPPSEEFYYPDGGRAWLVVLGCFIFSSITVGWGLVWGVFQAYYKENYLTGTSDTVLSFIGSVPGLGMTIFSVVTGKLADRYGYKPFLTVGAIIWVVSMIGAAFSTKLWHFFLTQGVFQSFSCALVYPLIVALPGQWFWKRRAFAIGIVVAGSSLGGALGSLILRGMLTALGLRKTLGIYACMDAVLLTIALLLIKERRRPEMNQKIIWFDKAFLTDPVFWSLGLCFLFCVIGYLPPIFFLPTFTKEKVPGISDLLAALPVTILNLSAAIGRTLIGYVADKMGPVNASLFVIIMSGLSQLLVWSFISNYAGIMAFAILYGFFCGCFLSLTPAVAARLYGPGRLAGLSGLLLLFNVPGNGAGAPLSGAVLNASGHNWQVVAGMNGALQITAAICLLYARFSRERRILVSY